MESYIINYGFVPFSISYLTLNQSYVVKIKVLEDLEQIGKDGYKNFHSEFWLEVLSQVPVLH